MRKKTNESPNTIRIGLSDEDSRFVERQRAAIIDTRKEVFRCLNIVVQLNNDAEFLSQDDKEVLGALCEKWERIYAPQLLPKKPKSLKECQADVTEEVTRKIQEILADYVPECQIEIAGELIKRVPVRDR